MRNSFAKLEEAIPHFDNKPLNFQESFRKIFGTALRDEEDVYFLTEDICGLMWDKVNNGKIIRKRQIYLLRGDEAPSLDEEKNKHHWPPSSRGGKEVVKMPEDFHKSWHVVFMNLYKEIEIEIFLNKIFTNREISGFKDLYKAIEKAKKEAKKIQKRG